MKYTKEEARVKKQALTSLQVRAIPPVVKTTGISPTMSMKFLADEPLTTQSLAQIMTMSASTVSHHLKLLKQAKLVKTQKDRKFVLYSPTSLIDDLIPGFYSYLNQED